MMDLKKRIKSAIALLLIITMLVTMTAMTVSAAVIPGKTGIGMAEWAFRAYNEGWVYKYGGSSAGAVDCSGLIRSYCDGKGGGAKALLDASSVNGSADDMPRIHGLGLWCEGHAGVYVGKNKDGVDMAIDMRNSKVNVVYSAMSTRYYSPWLKWYKISMISYPTNGWFDFNGETFYYKNGEFCVGVVKVDGKTYDFGKSGALKGEVDPNTLTTTKKTTTTTTTTTKATTTTTKKSTVTSTTTTTTTKKTTASTTTSAITSSTKSTTASSTKGTTGSSTKTSTKTSTTKSTTSSTAKQTSVKTSTKKTTSATSKKTSSTQKTEKTTQGSSKTISQATDTASTTQITTTTTERPTTTRTYSAYHAGDRNTDVKNLQKRLYDLGYYDQDITEYYGPFTRDAVKLFQIAIGAPPTGDADEETQKVLYSKDAPKYSDEYSLMSDESYYIEGDSLSGVVSDSDIKPLPVIKDSEGIASLGMTAAPYDFTRNYGELGALQTMGVFSYKSPSVFFYHDGESYKISEDMAKTLENCVFL